jgi:hypothetical protein
MKFTKAECKRRAGYWGRKAERARERGDRKAFWAASNMSRFWLHKVTGDKV